jgi:hypothetical protein
LWVCHTWSLLCSGCLFLLLHCWGFSLFNHESVLNFVKYFFCNNWQDHTGSPPPFLVALELELRASLLLGRYSTIWAIPQPIFSLLVEICGFFCEYFRLFLHSRNKSHLVMVYNSFDMLLNSTWEFLQQYSSGILVCTFPFFFFFFVYLFLKAIFS